MNKPLPSDKNDKNYLVFDGDVDALWVEDMNSVMDDNKLLTLPNGERIRLQSHCNLLFEVRFFFELKKTNYFVKIKRNVIINNTQITSGGRPAVCFPSNS